MDEDVISSSTVEFLDMLSADEEGRGWMFPCGGNQRRNYSFDGFASSIIVVC